MKKVHLLVAVLSLVFSLPAHALSDFSASNLSLLTQTLVDDLIKTVAIGAEHRAYMPASSMGWLIGLDVGVEATAVRLPNDFKSTIATASGTNASDVPTLVPIPKLNVHKGLPFGLDVGFSVISYQDRVKVFGGDVKWDFSDFVKILPFSTAFRFSGSSEKIWYISGTTWATDLVVSKDLFFIEPYFGTGLQFWSGNLDVPTGLPASSGLPSTVSASSSGTNAHFFAGLPIKLTLFHLTLDTDYSTAGIFTFGTKFSLNF